MGCAGAPVQPRTGCRRVFLTCARFSLGRNTCMCAHQPRPLGCSPLHSTLYPTCLSLLLGAKPRTTIRLLPQSLLFLNRSLSTSQTNSTSPYPPLPHDKHHSSDNVPGKPDHCPRCNPGTPTLGSYARNFRCAGTGALPAYLSTYKPAPFHTRPLSKLIGTSSSLHHLTLIEHIETCYQVAPPNKISLLYSPTCRH